MKTKERILEKSIELFNIHGYNKISSRTIAKELSISAGNLHYHYRHSEDIVKSLFLDLKKEMDKEMDDFQNLKHHTLESLYQFTLSIFNITYRYRFIFLSFFEILKDIPELEEEYSKLFSVRKKEFQTVFVDTSEKSIFLNNIPELILDNLIHQLFINIENWISYNEITMKLNGEEAVRFYSVIFLSMLYPFFTAKTQQDFIQKFS